MAFNSVNPWGVGLMLVGLAGSCLAKKLVQNERYVIPVRLFSLLVVMIGAAIAVLCAD